MNVEKLKSGSYRIRVTCDGVTYRKTLDHEPSKKEIDIIVGNLLNESEERKKESGTFAAACKDYIQDKSNTCSPSTLRGYAGMLRNTPEWFTKRNIYDITQKLVQRVVNEYAATHSPKSVYNFNSLIHAVLKTERPAMTLTTKIPDEIPRTVYVPTNEEVEAILREVKGTKYEVAIHLAALGLRRSEICALTIDDLDGNFLHVNKAKVQQQDDEWVVKPYLKTPESVRDVYVPDYVRDLILKQGYIYKGHPEHINSKLKKTEEALGIQSFSLHKLRHYFASEMHAMGASEADTLASGGWARSHVFKKTYLHPRNAAAAQMQYAKRFEKA